MTKQWHVIDRKSYNGPYSMQGERIIAAKGNKRYLLTTGYGGGQTVRGGAMRWDHGVVVQLLPKDTLHSLSQTPEGDINSVMDRALAGADPARPVLNIDPRTIVAALDLDKTE